MNKKVRNIEKTLKKIENNGALKVDEEKTDI